MGTRPCRRGAGRKPCRHRFFPQRQRFAIRRGLHADGFAEGGVARTPGIPRRIVVGRLPVVIPMPRAPAFVVAGGLDAPARALRHRGDVRPRGIFKDLDLRDKVRTDRACGEEKGCESHKSNRLPRIMHLVGDDFLLVRLELDAELHFLRVGFQAGVGFFHDLPVHPAVEVLDDADFDRLLLVVADLDFKGLVAPVVGACPL